MGTAADIQKLIQNAQRAQSLTDRAATEGQNAETVMNSFEKTMDRFNAQFGQMSEYEKQIAAMMGANGNGGPPLDATFPSTTALTQPRTASVAPVTSEIDHATGDPIKT
jgi:hypothetical protein